MKPFLIPESARQPGGLDPKLLVEYGPPGLGKTPITLALQESGKKVVIIDTHQGSHHYTRRDVDICALAQESGTTKWRIYLEACKQAREAQIDFLIIDHVGHIADWADNMALDLFCESPIGKSWPNKDDDGKILSKGFEGQSILELPGPKGSAGWGRLWEAFMRLIEAAYLGAPYKTIFIGHPMDKIAFATGPTDANVKQDDLVRPDEIDLGGPKMKRMFCSVMDAIGFMSRDWNGNRVNISFKTKDAFSRTRCPHLEGRQLWFSNPATLAEWARIYPNTLNEYLLPEDRAALADLIARYGGATAVTVQPEAAK